MSTKRDFQIIIKNTDLNDPEELRDVIAMLSRQKGEYYQRQAKRLRQALKKTERKP